MSDRLDPCYHQPVDFIRAEHQDTVEALRRLEIDMQCRRDEIWWRMYGSTEEEKKDRLRHIDRFLRKLYPILMNYYEYPEGYTEALWTAEEVPICGHYYNSFWGNSDGCPGKEDR